jgi:transcription-repair coupling factor (superfamily II helicase)
MDPLKRIAQADGRLHLVGAPEGFDALVMADAVRAVGGVSCFVARDEARAGAFIEALGFFAPGLEVLRFNNWDCLPYDRMGPTPGVSAARMAALSRLTHRKTGEPPLLVVTSTGALMQRLPPRELVRSAGFSARPGEDVDVELLEFYFAANGYARASTVSERGEFAIRGGVIDVFAPGAEEPARLDLFGDTLETLRTFDPLTQRSTGKLDRLDLLPVSEVLLDDKAVSRFRTGFTERFGASGDDALYATVSEGGRRQGMEHWLPLFYERTDTLFDYLGAEALLAFDHQVQEARDERLKTVQDYYEARRQALLDRTATYRALPPEALYLSAADWDRLTDAHRARRFSPFQREGADVVDLGARMGRTFAAERASDSGVLFEYVTAHAEKLIRDGKRVMFASWTEGSSDRLGSMLADHGMKAIRAARDWPEAQSTPAKTPLRIVLPLEHGFETDSLAVIAETDILGDRLARPRKKRRASNFIAEAASLSPGDLVVHIDHGIGRYEGLKTLDVNQAPHDCLELVYGGDSKLYLPVENIDLLTRYGAETEGVQLDRLGGAAWQSRKARAKQRLREMAEGLIKIAAARAMKSTAEIEPPSGLYDEFSARFPYHETDDQLAAISDVLEDLSSGKPMDRLICGDVGFGKTEVALRGAFVVAMSGKQVAVVCPTTLLARQHYKSFTDRFQGWPVKVRHLSRLVTAKEAAETRAALADGSVEVVIGTHAILAESIKFNDLGLVIVDEEQRFGVKHKEKLKALREDVHMLTLTATPIPRTLQMALSGIREMSIIATPPVDRLTVRTYVTPQDAILTREALLREKYRGGQAYYVAPRIKDLPEIERLLREQVPEVKVVVGHGQMSATQLEAVMTAFYDGQYDVLLSTTIVESGLDIPSANTLIVHRADMFGLAQLYQIRGRVGRAKTRAYAYLTTPPEQQLTEGAEKRLRVLQSLDSLGAGFQLASHDLDIRGGGNLLGDEQSGHIKEIGVELYQQMLEDAVAELKEGGGRELVDARGWSPQINAGVAVLIPEDYVRDLNVRLSLYRRISDAERVEEREQLAAEMIDRFGPLPSEAEQLLRVVTIKGLCRQAGVSKLDVGPKGAVAHFLNDEFANPMGLVHLVQRNAAGWKIRPDHKLVVKGDWPGPDARLTAAEKIATDLSRIARAEAQAA